MKRSWVKTNDGSPSLYVPELKQNYHSQHGALQESRHVFIKAGLHSFAEQESVSILEMGFGTGLNALLSHFEKAQPQQRIYYQSLEKYPLLPQEWSQITWPELFEQNPHYQGFYEALHGAKWDEAVELNPQFVLHKRQGDIKFLALGNEQFDLIYYDAFSPEAQPDLWSVEVFTKMRESLKPGGILVTYCVKGWVRRAMQAAGLQVTKIPGPPGKREMSRAIKA